jgi:hypothetical protein
MMLALLLIATGIWIFIIVADEVMEGGCPDTINTRISKRFRI